MLSIAVASALSMFAMQGSARDLPAIDVLATQPVRPESPSLMQAKSALQSVAERVSTNDTLGLPTFVWAKRGNDAYVPVNAKAAGPEALARTHLGRLLGGYRMTSADAARLEAVEARSLEGGASLVRFVHRVDGIEVFRESTSVLMDARGALVAVGGTMGPSSDVAGRSAGLFRMGPRDAVAAALKDFGFDASQARSALVAATQVADYTHFEWAGSRAPTEVALAEGVRARPVYFRDAYGLIPAYYVEVMVEEAKGVVSGYSYVIAAKSGETLFRHDLTADANFTYSAFAETTPPHVPYPGPHRRAATPHPTAMPDGFQPPLQAPNLITLQNAPYSRNDPWLADGATETDGNNVQAYVDIDDTDGFSGGDFTAPLSAPNAFSYFPNFSILPYSNAQRYSAVTNLFYTVNWLHDWWYDAGFDEVSNNAQNSNYGRGGIEGDRLRAEAQDWSGLNNANMLTPADGNRPRMQMYLFGESVGTYTTSGGVVIPSTQTLGTSSFGVAGFDLTRDVVLVDDGVDSDGAGTTSTNRDGCETPFVNAAAMVDKIVLIDRGLCNFELKVANALANGAAGVLLANNVAGPFTGGLAAANPALPFPGGRLPVVGISGADGATIKAALAAPSTVTARIQRNARDGDFDNTVIAHEWGHYISNRLVQNSAGLNTNHARGMGEGWGDFTALIMMVKEEDLTAPNGAGFNGVYGEAGFDTGGPAISPSLNNGYYYGFRRYPYSRDMTKNPLTYRHIVNGVALPVSPAPAFGASGASNAQVHNTGEVWSSLLWECYSNLLTDGGRLTFDEAQRRMKSYVATGYKLTPASPFFTEARDGVLAAAAASDIDDFEACAAGFAKRGLGFGAGNPTSRTASTNAGATESFLTEGGAVRTSTLAVEESLVATCDADGAIDNNENALLTFNVSSPGFSALTGGTVTLTSDQPGVSFADGGVVTLPAMAQYQTGSYSVPFSLSGAGPISTMTITATPAATTASAGAATATASSVTVRVNYDQADATSATESFEASDYINWTTGEELTANPAYNWVVATFSATDHRAYGVNPAEPALSYIESPDLTVSGPLSMTFLHRFQFEPGSWDGGQIEYSTDGGATWTTVTAGITPAYNGTLVADTANPRQGQAAFVNTQATQVPVTVDFGAGFVGETDFRVRFVIASDDAVGGYGWDIDNIAFTGITGTPFGSLVPPSGVCLPDLFQDSFEEQN